MTPECHTSELLPRPVATTARTEAAVLSNGRMLVLQDRPGSIVVCAKGQLWITQENDARDIILKAGQSFTLERFGKAILQGMPCAHVDIL